MSNVDRILVVDDDPALVRMIRLCLESEGFEVVTATNGLRALEVLAENDDFASIILDLQMPVMDGRAFYREMRARGYELPVLILSAYGADAARQELDADAAINKPFESDDLTETLKRLLAQAASPDA